MAQTPHFSIVTPTYNRAAFLAEMIRSVQAQSFQIYEHIIVDDGSTDNSEQLIAAFAKDDPRIIYIKQENKGRSAARNVAIETAKGEYICFLDSDDFWRAEHLSILNKATASAEKPALFATHLIWFFEKENREEKVFYQKRDLFFSDVEFVIANQFSNNCVCIHHTILKKHRFNSKLFINEDLELWGRIAAENSVVTIAKYTATLRVHAGNTSETTKDYITPQIEVFQLQLADSNVGKKLSPRFIKNRWRGLHELSIRHREATNDRWKLVFELLRFLILYPQNPQNKAKLVLLIYNLPGGWLVKRIFGSN